MDGESTTRDTQHTNDSDGAHQQAEILYGVSSRPPWLLCVLLAIQQFLTCFGSTVAYPLIISGAICITGDNVGISEMIGTVVFITGLSSVIQTTFGARLPIVQGASYAFVTPVFVILKNNKCPDFTLLGPDNTTLIEMGSDEHKAIWQSNMCELQGSLIIACVFQMIIGFSGLIGFLMRYIGPLTIAPTVSLIGLALFPVASRQSQNQWWICIMTIVLVVIFSQYLRDVEVKFPCMQAPLKIFSLFPVLFGIAIAWIICLILTEAGALTDEPGKWGYRARTDVNSDALEKSSWFRFPYPGQWGTPKVTLSGAMGMIAAVIASMIESVGDYYACARLAGAPPPPGSAVSRGIGVEGITCLLSGAWGTAGGNTSYSENIGAIGITKVGSRIVIQVAGVIMLLLGCFGKFGAFFVNIPEPVLAGLFFIMFGMVSAVGISNLQFVDLNSSRNLFVFGFSIFFGLSMPLWLAKNSDAIDTGDETVDQVLRVIMSTGMLVGGLVAFVLDNTIPGTKKERGLLVFENEKMATTQDLSMYDLPLIQPFLNRFRILRYIPFCPNFYGDNVKRNDADEAYKVTPHIDGVLDEESGVKPPNGHGKENHAFDDGNTLENTTF